MLTELYDRTHGFLNPTIVETAAAFPVSFSAIAEMFEGLRRDSTPQKMNYVRGYVDGREDYSLGEQFLAATNDFTCSLHALGDAIKVSFGGETPALGPHSGMIVNGGLQWSESLQSSLRNAASELVDLYGRQTISVDVTFFIGAYGATPFGVHVDDASHRTILFNFGPNEKGMAVWHNEEVHAQFGQVSNISDPNSIDATPEKYSIGPGQAFVLPSQRYHVGLNASLSTVAALVVDLVEDGKAAAKEAQALFESCGRLKPELRAALFELDGKTLCALQAKRLGSNGHLRYSIQRDLGCLDRLNPETVLSASAQFPLVRQPLRTGAIVYGRGRHHVTPMNISGPGFDMLVGNRPFTVKEFLLATDGSSTELKDQLALLTFATQSKAILEDVHESA